MTLIILLIKNINLIYHNLYKIMALNPKYETYKLSGLFFLLFTSCNSFLTILTFIYEQVGLTAIGPATISISYMAFILSTIYAPTCKWRIKNQMLIATVAYTINYSTGLIVPIVDLVFVKYLVTCGGSAICGLTAGLLWVSQGRYIHLVCQQSGVIDKKGEYFGIFSLIYCLSHISAGLITTFGLGLFNVQFYFLLITIIGILSIAFCWFFIHDISQVEKVTSKNNISENVAYQAEQNQLQSQSLTQIFRYYPKMSSVLFILIIDGICYGIHISEITHMIPSNIDSSLLNLYAGYCNIALGCGASLGGYISGIIGDKIGSKNSGYFGLSFFFAGCMLSLLTLAAQIFWTTLLSVFFWGFFLFYIQGWLFIVCSKQFKGRSESFSINKQLGSITCFFFQIIVMFTNNELNLKIIIGCISMLIIPAFISLKKLPNSKKSQEDISDNDSTEEPSMEQNLIKVSDFQ